MREVRSLQGPHTTLRAIKTFPFVDSVCVKPLYCSGLEMAALCRHGCGRQVVASCLQRLGYAHIRHSSAAAGADDVYDVVVVGGGVVGAAFAAKLGAYVCRQVATLPLTFPPPCPLQQARRSCVMPRLLWLRRGSLRHSPQ